MTGLVFLVGLAVALVALEALVRRAAGDHPHHDAPGYESHVVSGPWTGGDGASMGGGFDGDCGGGFGGDCGVF